MVLFDPEELVTTVARSQDSGTVEVNDVVPSVIKPLPPFKMTAQTSYIRPLEEMMMTEMKEKQIQDENFKDPILMKKYKNEDYRIRAFIMLITHGEKLKVWMPCKTQFEVE